MDCPNMGPCGVTGPARRPASAWGPVHEATSATRSLLQHWVSMGSLPPSGHISLLQCGVLLGLQGGYLLYCGPPRAAGGQPASPWSSLWAAGVPLLRHLEYLLLLLLH